MAYDCVNIFKLYEILRKFGVSTEISNLIFTLLLNREAYVIDSKSNIIGPVNLTTGLAQGSPLSPLLFNIYTAKLHHILPKGVELIQFADDFYLTVEGIGIE